MSWLVALSVLAIVATTVCGRPLDGCPKHCVCPINVPGYVYCRGRALKEIPDNIPLDTTIIDLSINAISEVHASKFAYLENLQYIDLSQNELKYETIRPDAFLHNPQLETLDLSFNALGKVPQLPSNLVTLNLLQIGVDELAEDSFTNLTSLRNLSISNNQLDKLPSNLFAKQTSLTKLGLGFNQFTDDVSFPSGLFEPLIHLEGIDLRFNQFTNVPAIFPRSLKHLAVIANKLTSLTRDSFSLYTNLEFLEVWHNQINSIEDDTFAPLSKLTTLDADLNNITRLANGTLRGLVSLEVLEMTLSNVGHVEPGAFDTLKNLKQLRFDANPLQTLSPRLLNNATLPNLSFATISGDTWVCDCKLRWLREFEDASPGLDSPHQMECASPSKVAGQVFDELEPSDFVCGQF